jgi:hypothetical protein
MPREDPTNWLHMEIEVPPRALPYGQAVLKVRPKQYYGVNRETVASVLLTNDALPGDRAHWEQMLDTFRPDDERDAAFSALAAIPFRDFPAGGRQELNSIVAPKLRLARWFRESGNPLPAFLADAVSLFREPDEEPVSSSSGAPIIGRPHKPAWPRIVELVRQLHQQHPHWRKKQLASEAWLRLAGEFSADELPSVATIQRAWPTFCVADPISPSTSSDRFSPFPAQGPSAALAVAQLTIFVSVERRQKIATGIILNSPASQNRAAPACAHSPAVEIHFAKSFREKNSLFRLRQCCFVDVTRSARETTDAQLRFCIASPCAAPPLLVEVAFAKCSAPGRRRNASSLAALRASAGSLGQFTTLAIADCGPRMRSSGLYPKRGGVNMP